MNGLMLPSVSPRFHRDDSQNPFHSFLVFLSPKRRTTANPFTVYGGVVSGHEGATLAARSVGKGGGGHVHRKTSGSVFKCSEIVGTCQTRGDIPDLLGTTVWVPTQGFPNEFVRDNPEATVSSDLGAQKAQESSSRGGSLQL